VRIINLGKQGRWDALPFPNRLARFLRKERPAVMHSYLAVLNTLATVLKPLLPGTRIILGVRASNVDLSRYDWLFSLASCMDRLMSNEGERKWLGGNAKRITERFESRKIFEMWESLAKEVVQGT
jgi:hypothetical protein